MIKAQHGADNRAAGAPHLPEAALAAARRFSPPGRALEIREYGRGNVNDTFLVRPETRTAFILQRLNPRVFPEPRLIMHNLQVLTHHLAQKLPQLPPPQGRRWEIPQVILTRDGRDHWLDPHGSFWRALSFIDSAYTVEAITDSRQAQEVGYALGRFHLLVSDLPPEHLADTLPGFHVTPLYVQHYDATLARSALPATPEMDLAHAFIKARRGWAAVLEQARQAGTLLVRPIHGDPKVNNVMLDQASGQAVGLIDLDTVKPGLVHYDIGDCLRSACNPRGEETPDWQQVYFDGELCRAVLQGYLSQARQFLTAGDYDYLFDAIRLIAFELGLRFCTDYLAGNVYFKAAHPRHNLDRALVQFQLTASLEAQEGAIRRLIREVQ